MFTLWAEGKIVFGENHIGKSFRDYPLLDSSAIWMVYGKKPQKRYIKPFNFTETDNILPEDGTPIHGLGMEFGGFEVKLESFCDIGRRPTCFIEVRVKNTAPYTAKSCIGFVVRSAKEKALVHGAPDEYVSYDPEISEFMSLPSTFSFEEGVLRDGEVFITADADAALSFDDEMGVLWMPLELEGGVETRIVLSFGKGEKNSFDYTEKRTVVKEYWENELLKINKLPSAISDKDLRTVKNLAVQILQNFCHYVGKESLVLRQGGLQRLIWPFEAKPALEAIERIGDFSDYVDRAISFYFDEMQLPDGEIDNLGEGWASVTASALYCLAKHCELKRDRDYWEKYREKAMLSFDWIKKQRRLSKDGDGEVSGLFPPKRGCDWPDVFQHWKNTDIWALFAISALGETAELFGDARAYEIKDEFRNYKKRMQEIFKPFADAAKESDELRIPLTPTGNDKPFLDAFHPYILQGAFAYAVLDDRELIEKARRYYVRRGIIENGLHSRMPYEDGNMNIWYTSSGDTYWILTYLRLGERKLARETIDALYKYSMTDEYYMIERYCVNDPYYVPWSPNVSASGRYILTLLEFYGEENDRTENKTI